jgi:hypothetical protein
MRDISWLILAIGSALIWSYTASFAQDAPPPPVQVIIGPDGVKVIVKVIDLKTGKEVPSVVTKTPSEEKEAKDHAFRGVDKKSPIATNKYIDELLLPFLLQEKLLLEKYGDDHPEVKEVRSRIKVVREYLEKSGVQLSPAEPLSADKKLDLLLKNMDELRKDVEAIKKKLDSKEPPAKIDLPPLPSLPPPPQKPANREAELERRLERMLREAEELRREIRDLQNQKKK